MLCSQSSGESAYYCSNGDDKDCNELAPVPDAPVGAVALVHVAGAHGAGGAVPGEVLLASVGLQVVDRGVLLQVAAAHEDALAVLVRAAVELDAGARAGDARHGGRVVVGVRLEGQLAQSGDAARVALDLAAHRRGVHHLKKQQQQRGRRRLRRQQQPPHF